MKSVSFISTKSWTRQQWVDYRTKGIGGSEASSVLGKNQWLSAIQLHNEKVGTFSMDKGQNFHMYRGSVQENVICQNYWKLYTDSPESVLINSQNPDFVPMKCRNTFGYFLNSKYDHLFASPDRLISKGHINRLTGKPLKTIGALEEKSPTSMECNKYEIGFPISYLIQLNHYMMMLEINYGELIILKDSTTPELFAFERNDELCQVLAEQTFEFWQNVLECRKILANRNLALEAGRLDEVMDLNYELAIREPQVDYFESCADFLKEKYRGINAIAPINGNDEHLLTVRDLVNVNKQLEPLDEEKTLLQNRLKKVMMDFQTDTISFGENGKLTWKEDTRGIRTFRNKVKFPEPVM